MLSMLFSVFSVFSVSVLQYYMYGVDLRTEDLFVWDYFQFCFLSSVIFRGMGMGLHRAVLKRT